MINYLRNFVITAAAVIVAFYILPGIHLQDLFSVVILVLVISLLNFFIRPIMILLTFPLTVFTAGLFLLVINTSIVLIADKFVAGFVVDSFGCAMFFSIIVSIVSALPGKNRSPDID